MDLALTPVADYEGEEAYVTSGHHHARSDHAKSENAGSDHPRPVLVTLSGAPQ
jgi:hypothetical protein